MRGTFIRLFITTHNHRTHANYMQSGMFLAFLEFIGLISHAGRKGILIGLLGGRGRGGDIIFNQKNIFFIRKKRKKQFFIFLLTLNDYHKT